MECSLINIKDIPIITLRYKSKKYVYVEIRVNYGTFSEDVPEMAHLIEHWLMLGTEKYPSRQSIYGAIEQVGGRINAYTANMHTGYWVKVPSQHLELAVDVLTQIFFHPLIKEENIANAKHPIDVELSGKRRDMNYVLSTARARSLFKKGGSGFMPLLKERLESVKNISKEQVYDTYKKIYTNPNISIGVGGNFEENDLIKLLNSKLEKRDGNKFEIKPILDFKEEIIKQDVKNEMISLTFNLPEEYPEATILNSLLGGRNSSRLPSLIRGKKNLSYSTGSAFLTSWGMNLLVTSSDANIGASNLVESLIIEECKKVANGDVTEEEFNNAKQSKIGRMEIREEIGSIIHDLLDNLRLNNKIYTLEQEISDINNVTFEQFKKYLTKLDFSTFAIARVLQK